MSPGIQSSGLDLSEIMKINSSVLIWTPDIRFPDASEVTFFTQVFKKIFHVFIEIYGD